MMRLTLYRPLPDSLTIKESEIDGLGLFATEDIYAYTRLGTSHILVDKEWIRTPLGGFYNHSDDPNCVKAEEFCGREKRFLYAIKDIKAGEELTVKYTFYKPIEDK